MVGDKDNNNFQHSVWHPLDETPLHQFTQQQAVGTYNWGLAEPSFIWVFCLVFCLAVGVGGGPLLAVLSGIMVGFGHIESK